MGAGIDYGMGASNVDVKTGIRYGVISCNSIMFEYTDLEYDYGEPTCPKCGNAAIAYDGLRAVTVGAAHAGEGSEEIDWECARHECADFMCDRCEYVFGSESAYGEEAIGWSYEADGYMLTDCLDNDVFVLASPFYTFAQFCSPCVPGAGNLDCADPDGAKTYCLGHDWFEDGRAPYPVFDVATGEEVMPCE